jgi:Na+/H+ antiporter NhaB
MKKWMSFLALIIALNNVSAQVNEETAVKTVVNQLFTAMKNADTVSLKSCFADSAVLQTISKNKFGATIVRNDAVSAFVKSIGNLPQEAADERISFETIKIDGDLASVWTPYQFYYKGSFSHCGVNSFQLVKLATGWKIQYLIDTRRKNGCPQ